MSYILWSWDLWLCVVQSEDIRLEPELYESCRQDIKLHCQNVVFGNAQVNSDELTL